VAASVVVNEKASATAEPLRSVVPEDLIIAPGELTEVMPASESLDAHGQLGLTDYLKKILTSKVYDIAIETPLQVAQRLSERMENTVLLKREDLQPVFSFKLRGAYNNMANLTAEQLKAGVITASAGNHAQGVAMSSARLGTSAIVAMPKATPAIKVNNVRRLGGQVELVGDNFDATSTWAKQAAIDTNRTYIPPFDHPDTIAGQGTIGIEIFNQRLGADIHAIFVPVGGGGLISGIAAYVKALRPEVRIIGVEPVGANAMAQSLAKGQMVKLGYVDSFADGVAVKQVGVECFRLCRSLVDGIVLVDTDATCGAIKDVFEDTRSILEPAGALAVAGAKAYCKRYDIKGATVVAITSGANMNFDKLRIVSELADIGTQTEALMASFIPETHGAFKKFYSTIGPDMNITEFKYRYSDNSEAKVLYSVTVKKVSEVADLQARLNASGMRTLDLSDNVLVKEHLRHLVGGHTCPINERIFQFAFPERPGSLALFLETIGTEWNITLFHYRRSGDILGVVLVGIQLSDKDDMDAFRDAATSLNASGFSFKEASDNSAIKLFLC